MRFSISRSRYVLAALALAQMLAAGPQPQELLGRWRSLGTASSGLGSMMTFRPNGVVDFSPGPVVEMTYRIEGDELILPPATKTGPEQRQKAEFTGQDQLRLAEAVFKRQGAAADASHLILGEWVGKREMGGRQMDAYYFFYPSGKCLFLLPFTTSSGKYTVQGATMRLELPNQEASEGKFQIDGDLLTMSGPNNSSYQLRRY